MLFQSQLIMGRSDSGSDSPDGAGDTQTATHLGKRWGLRPALCRARVTSACTGSAAGAQNWCSKTQYTWHNALAVTVLHGNTPGPGDPQTIPPRVPSSFPCVCLHKHNQLCLCINVTSIGEPTDVSVHACLCVYMRASPRVWACMLIYVTIYVTYESMVVVSTRRVCTPHHQVRHHTCLVETV